MTPTETPTRHLARFVHGSRWDLLPLRVQHEALRAFVNWVGCAYGGSNHTAVERALAAARSLSASQECTVIGRRERLDPLGAALINGLSVGVNAFDDAHVQTVIHPAAPTVSALLAHAEQRRVSGPDFLLALVLSHEIQCRLSCAVAVAPATSHLGHFLTGLTGAAGVAAGVAKVAGLSEQQILWAIGLGVMQGSGFRSSHGSMASPFIPGDAGRNGLLAARLAEQGFTCSEEPLNSPNGMMQVVGRPADVGQLVDGLGQRWECMNVAIKPFPNGCVVHAATDACLELTRSPEFDSAQIARVDLEVSPLTMQLADRRVPKDACEAWVGLYHWAAATLLHRQAGLAQASDEAVLEPAVIELSRSVFARAEPGLKTDEARAYVTLYDGRRIEAEARPHVGSAGRPLSDAQLEEKFLSQVQPRIGAKSAVELWNRCWELPDADDVAASAPGYWGGSAPLSETQTTIARAS